MLFRSKESSLQNEAKKMVKEIKEFKSEWLKPNITPDTIKAFGASVDQITNPFIQKLEEHLAHHPSPSLQRLLLALYETKKEFFDSLQQLTPIPTDGEEVNTKIKHQMIIVTCDDAIAKLTEPKAKNKPSACSIS